MGHSPFHTYAPILALGLPSPLLFPEPLLIIQRTAYTSRALHGGKIPWEFDWLRDLQPRGEAQES